MNVLDTIVNAHDGAAVRQLGSQFGRAVFRRRRSGQVGRRHRGHADSLLDQDRDGSVRDECQVNDRPLQ